MKKNYLFTLGLSFLLSIQVQAQNSTNSTLDCVAGLGGGSDPNFLKFQITGTTLSHETLVASSVYYHEYPPEGNLTATLIAGQQYSAFTFTSSEAVIGMWIDYNHDDDFGEYEFFLLVNSMSSQNNTTFTVSEDALLGNTKIRLRTRGYGTSIAATSACTSFGSGETRDYTVLISRNLSVNDYGKESGKIQVYPNPVKNTITIRDFSQIKEVALFDVSGKFLANSTTNLLDVSNYANGIYIIKAYYLDGSTSVGKVIKQ